MASPSPAKKAKKNQEGKYIPWLLASIAKVKGQKQRPDEARVCHVMSVAFGVSEEEALIQLELAVKAGAVMRLESKGKSSYKDPSVHAGFKGEYIFLLHHFVYCNIFPYFTSSFKISNQVFSHSTTSLRKVRDQINQ